MSNTDDEAEITRLASNTFEYEYAQRRLSILGATECADDGEAVGEDGLTDHERRICEQTNCPPENFLAVRRAFRGG